MATDEGHGARVIFVIGAGPGVGLAVAHRFAREGWAVGLVARDRARLEGSVADLLGDGAPRAEAAAADVGSASELHAALAALRVVLGEPTVLVYNTSMFVEGGGPAGSVLDDVLEGLRVGVLGALVALQDVAPSMSAAGGGTVLITGGGLALKPSTYSAGLSMQKAAVRALALTGCDELRDRGVHVATVTIDGVVGRGPTMEPPVIAERYWELHQETVTAPPSEWRAEIIHR